MSVCLGIATLLGFGYRATREWQRSSELLIERDTEESADLLVTAVTRDMRGAHSRVLANRDWGELSLESLTDTSDQVATAFARYPYPESFFSWQRDSPHGVVFFNRANRFPAWMPQPTEPNRYPVALVTNPPEADALREKVAAFSAATVPLRDVRHDARRPAVSDRRTARVRRPAAGNAALGHRLHGQPGMGPAVVLFGHPLAGGADRHARQQPRHRGPRRQQDSGSGDVESGRRRAGRASFPLLFLDPSVSMVALGSDPAVRTWTIRTSQSTDSALVGAAQGADEALLAAGAAALTLALGLILAIRAVRAGVALTAMRSDFVSSVTHELKTPLANIRAMADTLARRPIGGETVRDYAELLMQEARRLTRLVDNLLAYARVTDVTEMYSFEPIAPAELVDDVLQNFRHPLSEREFTVEVEIPVDLPLVRADRTAMMLALDNLVDNAIRYSPQEHFIRISARRDRPERRHRSAGSRRRHSRRTSCRSSGASSRAAGWRGPTAAASGSPSSAESSPITRARSCSTANRARARRQRYIYPSRETERGRADPHR